MDSLGLSASVDRCPAFQAAIDPRDRAAMAVHFDDRYYLAAHPELRHSGVDPLEHYIREGWRAGFNPSRQFDVRFYLSTHQDVAAAGINPLLHYALVGAQEGRSTRRPMDTERDHLAASSAPSARITDWLLNADRSPPLPPSVVVQALAGQADRAGLAISVSHDDYAVNVGGVQSLIAYEQAGFAASGWGYLHLSPAAPLPVLAGADAGETFRFRVRLNGEAMGVAMAHDVAVAVARLRSRGQALAVVLHHLMGHAPEVLAEIAAAAGTRPIVWVHDFFTLCPSYALMRNDVRFCGAPPSDSAACKICTFGMDRSAHLPRIEVFFEAMRPTVLAPSRVALDLWRRRGWLPHDAAEIVPLARLVTTTGEADDAAPQPSRAGRLRVAHLGARVGHKGWIVFEELAMAFARDPRYAFFHLGLESGPPLPGCIRHVPVRVSMDDREGMIDAVAERRIDVVINWSLWPETFCFAVHEALAAGAFVVARAGAGNVWPAVQAHAPGQGCVLERESDLTELFLSGAILERVARGRRQRGAIVVGQGTADWLLGKTSASGLWDVRHAGDEGADREPMALAGAAVV